MKRLYALGILALLCAALLMAALRSGDNRPQETPPEPSEAVEEPLGIDRRLAGAWEATVELSGREADAVRLRYTFDPEGTYTLRVCNAWEETVEAQGNYRAQEDRLYLSAGLEYPVDRLVYDSYRLEGNVLTLLENSQGDMGGFYPLALTRSDET